MGWILCLIFTLILDSPLLNIEKNFLFPMRIQPAVKKVANDEEIAMKSIKE